MSEDFSVSVKNNLNKFSCALNSIYAHELKDFSVGVKNNLNKFSCVLDSIRADELTESDIIKHGTGDFWQILTEPQYTCSGIEFEVLWLDVDSPDNTQSVCFAPNSQFELVSHQSSHLAPGRAA